MGNQTEETKEKNFPKKKFRAGAISATIWENKGKKDNNEFTYQTVTIERNYTDKDDKWQTTNSFRVNDLPKLKLAAKLAYEYIILGEDEKEVEEVTKKYEEVVK